MRTFFLLCAINLLISLSIIPQQTITGTLEHDGTIRSYILYIPASYNANEACPLLMSFHGFSSNSEVNFAYTDFKSIADTAGFILVHPQGSNFNGVPHWNVGGFTLGSNIDDIGFVSSLIDTLSSDYTVDKDRIYSTGMSNGGYMSFLLACQLSDKIAAVASVTGSMTPQTFNDCSPQHPTAVLQIHGTKDGTVPYLGGQVWTKSIDDVLKYWTNYNNCNEEASVFNIPNTNMSDGSTVDHFIFSEGDNCVSTEHFKVYNGDHDWPGVWGNMDINASQEVWNFLSQYDINGLIGCSPSSTSGVDTPIDFKVYPNPVNSHFTIQTSYEGITEFTVINSLGNQILLGYTNGYLTNIDGSSFTRGVYFVKMGSKAIRFVKP